MNHNWQQWLFALCYELALELAKQRPSIASKWWYKRLLEWCRPAWVEWKTETTLQAVDKQAKVLVEQWEVEEREHRSEALAAKAQELFPKATVTPLPNTAVPSVMIVHEAPDDASDAIKALGAELRITWTLGSPDLSR
jgi:hypothetical protein